MRRWLAHRRLALVLAALGALLAVPSLSYGFVLDDFGLRAVALGIREPGVRPGARFDLFSFIEADPATITRQIDRGILPWWTSMGLRARFFRPLASFTHWADFQLWPHSPLPMHLVNVSLVCAVVIAAAMAYRRTLGATWVAGLATLFYALDPGHAIAASWIAGRNTALSPLFGLLAIVAHDRGRRDGWRAGVPLATTAFALSLLSSEGGIATLSYLVAHAITLDPARGRSRLRALAPLVPYAAVAAAWLVAYKAFGYGASGSQMYVDPARDPAGYARAALLRAPFLLNGAWGVPSATSFVFLSTRAIVAVSVFGALFAALVVRVAWPILRTDPVARFFLIGSLLSLPPICAVLPNDRLLFFVGFGALGLAAKIVGRSFDRPDSKGARDGAGMRALAWFFVVLHGPLAIPAYALQPVFFQSIIRLSRSPFDNVLLDPDVPRQTAVFVNPPTAFFVTHLATMRFRSARPTPLRWRVIANGIYPLTVARTDAWTLTARTEGGLLQEAGTWSVEGDPPSPLLKWSYVLQHLTNLVRPRDERMHVGDRLRLTDLDVEVRAVTDDGRPLEVAFVFAMPLESPALRWLRWDGAGYVRFTPPAVGDSVRLAGSPIEMTR